MVAAALVVAVATVVEVALCVAAGVGRRVLEKLELP